MSLNIPRNFFELLDHVKVNVDEKLRTVINKRRIEGHPVNSRTIDASNAAVFDWEEWRTIKRDMTPQQLERIGLQERDAGACPGVN